MKKILLIISIFFISINFVYAKEEVKFSKCVDGDTIKVLVGKKEYTVRMLAIDTPESVHPTKGVEYYGKEASEYTCNKAKNAKKIELEYDDNSDKKDKYDRLLAWVFIDDILHQQSLVENGYAKVAYLYNDYKYTSLLQDKQELASTKNIGIWDEEAASNYDGNVMETEDEETKNDTKLSSKEQEYTTKDIIVIVILLLIIVFAGKSTIKNKAKKKLKKYLD